MTAAKATLPQVTDKTAPEVPPPVPAGGRTSEKTRARLEDLRPHPRNPRRISPARLAQLQRTLEAEPDLLEARPIIALPDGTVVAGNQRLAAAAALGWESIPVVYADLSPEEVTRWMLLDNRGFGEDDRDAVAVLLGELEAADSDLELTGYDPADLEVMLRELEQPGLSDLDQIPPVPNRAPRSSQGAIYELGTHRLMCGDATDASHVDALLQGESVALLFTSPPYLEAREYGGKEDLDREHLATFLDACAGRCDLIAVNLGIIRRGGEVVRFWDAYIAAAERAGLALLSWNVWDRGQPWSVAQNTALFPIEHEWVFVFGRPGSRNLNLTVANKSPGLRTGITNRQADGSLRKARPKRVRDHRALGTIFRSAPHLGPDIGHPAMFPVAFPQAYIESCSGRGDAILDTFAGSGTSIIAAELTGRRCFAMEIDPAYCDVIRQRYADYVDRPELAP